MAFPRSTCLLLLLASFLLTPLEGHTFNVMDYGAIGNGRTDDSEAFMKAWSDVCKASASPTFLVPGDRRFLINPVVFEGRCRSKKLKFKVDGTITAPSEPSKWKCINKQCHSWISFKHVDGLVISGSGTIDGNAEKWWKQGRVTGVRPNALVVARSNNVQLHDLSFKDNPHMHVVFHHCDGVKISHISIDAPEDSPNTDGIHLKETASVTIEHCTIGTGDDCISLVDGSTHIDMRHIKCGPGHGISIGSLGKFGLSETVEYIHVKDAQFTGTTNGVRIKTWQGGRGHARNMIFEKIRSSDSEYPIIIDQFYCDHTECHDKPNAVEIRNISYIDVKGKSKKENAVKIACSDTVPCRDIFMQNINLIYDQSGKQASAYCKNVINGYYHGVVRPKISCLQNDKLP
ncbi:polygalacturonase-like [Vitis riparia]|uniref:polygalacturonase-like n=1 Tax=Vitis riparia TaxID=96939 RepID=UPI00155ACD72|nr:polygalacturonase-like [Vitis riparia]